MDYIKKLTTRGLPPTSQIVKNIAEEIIRYKVEKNWVRDFIHQRNKVLVSIYLRNIDNKWVKSKYRPIVEFFFNLVN